MKSQALAALAATACLSLSAAAADNPFDAFKSKMKPGMYSYEMSGEMPGMPQGMGKMNHTFEHCVTPEDINRGDVKGGRGMPENCEVKDFKSSGNTVDYTMACKPSADHKGPPGGMQAHNHMTFQDGGYVMDMTMSMPGPGGQPMQMKQHMVATYKGACPGK